MTGSSWPQQLQQLSQNAPCVLVTLNLILGSAPRESGCRMIVTADAAFGSIGGGNLEYTATRQAREMLLQSAQPRQRHEPFGLGPALNQCCGGTVTLLFEVFSFDCPAWVADLAEGLEQQEPRVLVMAIDHAEPLRWVVNSDDSPPAAIPPAIWNRAQEILNGSPASAAEGEGGRIVSIKDEKASADTWWLERIQPELQPLVLFGAGHVGHEVARLLERLPFATTWVDDRAGVFPVQATENVHAVHSDDPAVQVASAVPGSIFVVMTHSHQLDEDICFNILRRGDFCWLGLIGSDTKRRRFVQRLNRRGVEEKLLNRLICPIGLVGGHDGIQGKQPATIALSLVAQLMMEKPWIHANN